MTSAELLTQAVELAAAAEQATKKASEALVALNKLLDDALAADTKTVQRVEAAMAAPPPVKPTGKVPIRVRLLEALATYGALTRAEVYFYTGLSMTSGPMGKLYAELRRDEVIDDTNNGGVVLVDKSCECFFKRTRVDSFELFQAFAARLGGNAEEILNAHHRMGRPAKSDRELLCRNAEVSLTSGPTSAAFARLAKVEVLTSHRGFITFSDWYLKAIAPSVRVFDRGTGETRLHDAKSGAVK